LNDTNSTDSANSTSNNETDTGITDSNSTDDANSTNNETDLGASVTAAKFSAKIDTNRLSR
jgi:hypothetical protein